RRENMAGSLPFCCACEEKRLWDKRKNRRGDRVWPNSLICPRSARWWFVRNTAVRIALAGQYGDRRNISAQLRRGNISSGRCEKIAEATASGRILHSPLWWLRSDAVRIGLSGQYGDRRNISAQMRRENVSSVPALQRAVTAKRCHPGAFRATWLAADRIFHTFQPRR